MALLVRMWRVLGRTVTMTFVSRVARRYPIVSATLFVWRWWKRRTSRTDHSVVRLRRGESIVVTDRSN